MKITITLDTCRACRHRNHSGAFTARGPRQICGHPDASGVKRTTKRKFCAEYPEYTGRNFAYFDYHWIHRVLTKSSEEKIKKIPRWCPLKHGSKY